MKLKLALTFIALSLCAAAQTIPKVTLSGPLSDLTITNNSDRPVVAAMVLYFGADGKERAGDEKMFILDSPNYLATGDSVKLGTFTKGKGSEGVVSAKVAAVVFSDGEFVGGDDREASNFRRNMEERFQAMRAVFGLAKSGDWGKIKALYTADANGDLWKAAVASRLLRVHDKGGDINSLKHYGNLPASTWKGSLLNRLRIPEAFQAIADWFLPTVYAQNHTFCCTAPWPQDSSTDSYHPTQWTYYCSDSNPNIPCPGKGQQTPFEGITATCTAIPPASAYTTGTEINFGQDLNAVWIQDAATSTQNPWVLDVKGSCHDNSGFYPPEYAEYVKYCEDTPNYLPHKISDTTKNICGATATGYPN